MAQEMAVDVTQALLLVKQRLNKLVGITKLDDYLTARIHGAIEEIEGRGIVLTDSMSDMMLVVDYTVYQYQSRDKAEGMPGWLTARLRQRWMQGGAANDP